MRGLFDRREDAELLAATASDPEAFGAFYDRYERSILSYFQRRTGDPQLTADLAAEVFAAALEHTADFDQTRAGPNAAPWLFAIARNTLIDSLRRGRIAADARYRAGLRDPLALDDEAYERIEQITDIAPELESLIKDLPSEQRIALLARVVDERDYHDIAGELQTSELVVRKRVSRALATLRQTLNECAS